VAAEQQQYRRRTTLIEWVEKACAFFEMQLCGRADGRRGSICRSVALTSTSGRATGSALRQTDGGRCSKYLTKEGASVEELIEAGLVVQPDEGPDGKSRQPWDRFRNRVIFPITDHSDA